MGTSVGTPAMQGWGSTGCLAWCLCRLCHAGEVGVLWAGCPARGTGQAGSHLLLACWAEGWSSQHCSLGSDSNVTLSHA